MPPAPTQPHTAVRPCAVGRSERWCIQMDYITSQLGNDDRHRSRAFAVGKVFGLPRRHTTYYSAYMSWIQAPDRCTGPAAIVCTHRSGKFFRLREQMREGGDQDVRMTDQTMDLCSTRTRTDIKERCMAARIDCSSSSSSSCDAACVWVRGRRGGRRERRDDARRRHATRGFLRSPLHGNVLG